MANVWFARDGKTPNSGGPFAVMPLAECAEKLGLTVQDYVKPLSDTPKFNIDSRLGEYTPYRHVVVEVAEKEAKATGWKPGFYYLPDLSPTQVERRLA
jgi:hypothetical protein